VQAGFFYFSENSSLNSGTKRQFNNVLTQATQYIDPIVNTHSKAFFGYATYNLFDNIKLSGGIRQTWDDRKRVGIGYSYTGGILTRTSDQGGSSKSNKLTYHAGIDWTPSTETLLYFKLDTGYKAGGFNSAGVAEPFPYGPETSRVFEGGLKQQLFNRSVNFTLDGFYNTYKGYQADLGLCGTCTNTVAGTVNAGSATVWGIEGAFNAIVPVLGTASVAVNYLSAKFTDFDATYTNQAPDGGQRATIPVDLSDNYMPQSPKWSIVASLDHVFDLSEHGSIEANASMSYRARQYFDIYNWQDTSQRGYVLGNTYIQYRTADKRYSIQVYAQNITNKLYFIYAAEGGAGGSYQYAYGAPRTIGGKLTAAF
jgi:iron complex outermembrane receptor protein